MNPDIVAALAPWVTGISIVAALLMFAVSRVPIEKEEKNKIGLGERKRIRFRAALRAIECAGMLFIALLFLLATHSILSMFRPLICFSPRGVITWYLIEAGIIAMGFMTAIFFLSNLVQIILDPIIAIVYEIRTVVWPRIREFFD